MTRVIEFLMSRKLEEMESHITDSLGGMDNSSNKRVKLGCDGADSTTPASRSDRPFPFLDLPGELRDGIYDAAMIDNSPFRLYKRRERAEDTMTEAFTNLTNLVQVYRDDSNAGQSAADQDATQTPPAPVALGLTAAVRNAPATSLMLASKAVRDDYAKRVQRAKELVLKDSENYAFLPVHLPEYVKDVWQATLHLILFCHNCPLVPHTANAHCHASHELTHHIRWITAMLPQLPSLRSLTIHAYLCYDSYRPGSTAKLPCEAILEHRFRELRGLLPKLKKLTLGKYDYFSQTDLEGERVVLMEWEVQGKGWVERRVPVAEDAKNEEQGEGKGEQQKEAVEQVEDVDEEDESDA